MQAELDEAQQTLDVLTSLLAIWDLERSVNFAIDVPRGTYPVPPNRYVRMRMRMSPSRQCCGEEQNTYVYISLSIWYICCS